MLRRGQACRRVRTARAEFNAILRLIRTFKAVNEDWPHVPSARPLPPLRPARSYARPLRVSLHSCVCARVRDLENVLVPGVHAAGALMARHAKRILLYYY